MGWATRKVFGFIAKPNRASTSSGPTQHVAAWWRDATRKHAGRNLSATLIGLTGLITACALQPLWAGAPAMSVPGQFGVSATGAATYTVPIAVPPGTSGVAPVLALNYSSQSGNGTVGLGWFLSGLDGIERCPRTFAQDGLHGSVNYDGNDRFCWAGQRLVAISGSYGANGTVYHTELDVFSKIVSYGSAGSGPEYFKIWTKSGQILEFGRTSDSRILTTNGSGTARSWALDKVSDVKGNFFSVTYYNDTANGQLYPTQIDYTGNSNTGQTPQNSVRFVYNTQRPDVTPLYHAGSVTRTTVLLSNVKAYTGSTLVYDYQLTYELGTATRHSRLTSIRLCEGSGTCFKSTSFGWQGTRDTISAGTSTQSFLSSDVAIGDFNGDGFNDLVSMNSSYSFDGSFNHANLDVSLRNETGTFQTASVPLIYAGPKPPTVKPILLGLLDNTGNGLSGFYFAQDYGVIYTSPYGGTQVGMSSVFTVPNNGSLTATSDDLNRVADIYATYENGSPSSQTHLYNVLGDFDGDGRQEHSSINATSDDPNNPYGSGIITGDFDGDGCTDVLFQTSSNHNVTYSCSPASSSANGPYIANARVVTGDYNGDGMMDILLLPQSGSGTLYFSTGVGFVASSYVVPSAWAGAYVSNDIAAGHTVLAGDFNGDGKTDLAEIASGINIYLSTGDGFVLAATLSSSTGYAPAVGDLNNDGIPDILVGHTLSTIAYTPELMNIVTDGLNASTTITYDRLNKNGTFYTKCPNSPSSYLCGDTYPTQAADGPFYVVKQVDSSNGIGSNFTTTYAYAGYKSDLRGRGSLGFAQTKSTDPRNVVSTSSYRQTFPFIGQLASQTATLGSTTVSSLTNDQFTDQTLSTPGGQPPVHFAAVTQNTKTGNDIDGTALPTISSTYHYDCQDTPSTCFGNVLTAGETVSTSGTQRSSKTVTNTYWNRTDGDYWLIGRVTGTTVTRTAADDQGVATVNHAPTANADSVTTDEGTALTFDPRGNDTDPDSDPLRIISAGPASHGTVVINNGSSLKYTPANLYYGSDSFSYTISDGQGHVANATVSVTVNYVAPPDGTFTSNVSAVVPGGTATLTWSGIQRATSASISGSGVSISGGSMPVNPSAPSSTYALVLTGPGGSTTKQVTVSVVPAPTGTVSVSPDHIAANGTSTLTWSFQNATSVTVDHSVGTFTGGSGSAPVHPSATTTYLVTATGPTGQLPLQATVTVVGTPSGTLVASPQSVNLGQSATLTYHTTNTDTASIGPGVGTVTPPDGQRTVTPTATTTYTLSMHGIGGDNTATATVAIPAPSGTFSVDQTAIQPGQSTTLHWTSLNATGATINGSAVSPVSSGQMNVSPTTTTTYTLILSGPTSPSATKQVTVAVAPSGTLTASPTSVNLGSQSTLTWSTSNATSTAIDHGVGTVSPASGSSVNVTPTATTTYTLTMSGPGGTSYASATVAIPPPDGSFTASSYNITAGGSTTLSWSGSNTTSVAIAGVGSYAGSGGSVNVSPGSTTTYTLTFYGPSGSTPKQVTVNVYPAPTASLSVNPTSINQGGSTTLSWSSTNAASATINNGVGGVSASGTRSVSPSSSTTYVLTVTNGAGTQATSSAAVTVVLNRSPVAANDSATASGLGGYPPGSAGYIAYIYPLTNDSDPDGDTLTITAVTKGTYGSYVDFSSGNMIVYESDGPAFGNAGADTISYTISDGHGHTATASIYIHK